MQNEGRRKMVEMKWVFKYFGSLKALDNVSLNVFDGEKVVIIGPSGSGKSTLLRSINRLEEVNAGTIIVDGFDIYDANVNINKVREEVGMVFQSFNVFPHKTVLQNLMLAQIVVRKRGKEEAEKIAYGLLDKVGIREKANVYPTKLSGGQQQRVAIARALAMDPICMLFDEPTSALDPEMINEVLDVMVKLALEGMTMMVVTHEMGFARKVAHRVIFMDHGSIVEDAATDHFFGAPHSERAQLFLSKILSH